MKIIENIFGDQKERFKRALASFKKWAAKPHAQDELIQQAWNLHNISKTGSEVEILKEQRKYDVMKRDFTNKFGRINDFYINLIQYLESSAKNELYRRRLTGVIK